MMEQDCLKWFKKCFYGYHILYHYQLGTKTQQVSEAEYFIRGKPFSVKVKLSYVRRLVGWSVRKFHFLFLLLSIIFKSGDCVCIGFRSQSPSLPPPLPHKSQTKPETRRMMKKYKFITEMSQK